MRIRGRTLVLFAFLVGAIALPTGAFGATASELKTLAEQTYKMTCTVNVTDITCEGPTSRIAVWSALIAPASGDLTKLRTDATEFGQPPMDTGSRDWMIDMHHTACGDLNGVTGFVDKVAALVAAGSYGPTSIGTCVMSGGMAPDSNGRAKYTVVSNVTAPKPTPSPTPKPTVKPTPKPTPTAAPSAPPTLGPSLAPSPSASPSPTPVATPTSLPTPAATVPGVVSPILATPGPTSAPGTPPPGGGSSSFVDSIPSFDGVATDARSLGGSALLALLLLLIGFAAELFNNTVENNYDEISGWFRKGRFGRVSGWMRRHARLGVLGFLVLTALVSSFVDPSFGFDLRSFFEFLGFLVGVIVVLASFKGPPMLAHRRKTGELGHLRPLPWALAIAAAFVLVSRVGNLQPGYLYGIVLGAIFTREVADDEEGRETVYGSIWTLFASLVAWLLLTWVRALGLPSGDPGGTFALTALGCILVSGLEATAFGLMPLRFMPGYAIYRWNRPLWAVLFFLSVFAFIHILIGPTSGYVSTLAPAAFIAALGVFAVFGALSIGTWGYFRFRPAPGAQDLER
jgi:hypothetical protein